jgi:TonB family protein
MENPKTWKRAGWFLMFAALAAVLAAAGNKQPVARERAVPAYPYELRRQKISGSVEVEFIIGVEGRIVAAQVIRSTHAGFNQNALNAVKKWRFEPGEKNGVKVNVRASQRIDFNLPTRRQVHPFELFGQSKGVASVAYWLDQDRRLVRAEVLKASAPGFGKAALAVAADEWVYGPESGIPLEPGRHEVEYRFGRPEAALGKYARQILKAAAKPGAAFPDETALDEPLVPVLQEQALYPVSLRETGITGRAIIEYFVDPDGLAQAPRVVEASHEDFGYAAAQAVGQWEFHPPLRQGKPTLIRTRVLMEFKRDMP